MIPEIAGETVTPAWVRGELDRLRRQLRFAMIADRAMPLILTIAGLVLGSLLVDWLLDLSKAVRWVLFVGGLAGLGVVVRHGVWRVLQLPLTDLDLARAIEARQPGLGEAALAALEFGDDHGSAARRLALRNRCRELAELEIRGVVNRDLARRRLAGVGALMAVGVVTFWAAPDVMGIWARRWLPPGDAVWPTRTSLYLPAARGGTLYVPAGEMVPVELALTPDYEEPQTVRATLATDSRTLWEGTCEVAGPGQWLTHLRAPATTALLTVEGGDFRFDTKVVPVVRPRVGTVVVRGSHPQYDAEQVFDNAEKLANANLLAGSAVVVEMTIVGAVEQVRLRDDNGLAVPVSAVGDGQYRAAWTHGEARNLRVECRSPAAEIAGVPFAFTVGLQRDAVPQVTTTIAKASRLVTTRGPQVGRRVTPAARIPLLVQASDDFTLDTVALELKLEMADGTVGMNRRELVAAGERQLDSWQQSLVLDLGELELPIDSRVLVTGVGRDRRSEDGELGRSGTLVFEVVPAEALYRDLVRRMQGQRARLRQVLERSEKRRDELAREELAPAKTAARWLREHQQDEQRVRNSREAVARVLAEAYWNQVGSDDVRELLRRTVLDGMDRLIGPLHEEHGATLRSLQQKPDNQLNAAATQEMVVIELQDLLSAMSQWESFADVVRQLDEIIDLQRDIRDAAETIKKADTDSLFDD